MPDTLVLYRAWFKEHAQNPCYTCDDMYFGFIGGHRQAREHLVPKIKKLEEENEALHKLVLSLTKQQGLSTL